MSNPTVTINGERQFCAGTNHADGQQFGHTVTAYATVRSESPAGTRFHYCLASLPDVYRHRIVLVTRNTLELAEGDVVYTYGHRLVLGARRDIAGAYGPAAAFHGTPAPELDAMAMYPAELEAEPWITRWIEADGHWTIQGNARATWAVETTVEAELARAFNPLGSNLERVLALGHRNRHGHDLTGYYVGDAIRELVRTCCGPDLELTPAELVAEHTGRQAASELEARQDERFRRYVAGASVREVEGRR